MRSRNWLVLTVAVFVCLFVFTAPTALAASSKKVAIEETIEAPDILKNATVNLYCRLKSGKKTFSSSGSGVLISDRGVILTNAHVAQYFLLPAEKGKITGWCSVRTGSPAKETYTASVLYLPSVWVEDNAAELKKKVPKGSGKNDFALLYITGVKKGALSEKFPALPLGFESTEQSAVTILGYPTEKLSFDKVRSKLGLVAASSTITNIQSFDRNGLADVIALASSAAGSNGVSGGPVVDEQGDVIGIVSTKSVAKDSRALRAITLSYINRAIVSQTHLPLNALLSGDLKARVEITKTQLSGELLKIISNGLLKKK